MPRRAAKAAYPSRFAPAGGTSRGRCSLILSATAVAPGSVAREWQPETRGQRQRRRRLRSPRFPQRRCHPPETSLRAFDADRAPVVQLGVAFGRVSPAGSKIWNSPGCRTKVFSWRKKTVSSPTVMARSPRPTVTPRMAAPRQHLAPLWPPARHRALLQRFLSAASFMAKVRQVGYRTFCSWYWEGV